MKTVEELRADPRVIQAEKFLKNAGVTDAWWDGLLSQLTSLQTWHAELFHEADPNLRKKRARITKQMRKLAQLLENDSYIGDFYPHYIDDERRDPVLRIGKPHVSALSIGQWLLEYADHAESDSPYVGPYALFQDRQGNSKKNFVVRGTYYWIGWYLSVGRNLEIVSLQGPRNVETALLASAVLGEKVTENDVTQIRRNERRRNIVD